MRATPRERETTELSADATEMEAWIVERTTRLVNTGCVVAYVGDNQEEARVLTLEINKAVHELEELREELAQRGH